MKQYTKPMISIDDGMAEGVYAASGASDDITISVPDITANWGGRGEVKITLNLKKIASSQSKVVLNFNMNLASGWLTRWDGGASASVSGNSLTLSWSSTPESAEIMLQADGDITQLKCTGYAYSNN